MKLEKNNAGDFKIELTFNGFCAKNDRNYERKSGVIYLSEFDILKIEELTQREYGIGDIISEDLVETMNKTKNIGERYEEMLDAGYTHEQISLLYNMVDWQSMFTLGYEIDFD